MQSVKMAERHSKTVAQRVARQDEIRRMLARRFTPSQIAAELNIAPSAVSYWLRKLESDAQSAVADRATEIRAALDSLAEVEREAWAAWESSKGEVQTVTRALGFEAKGSVDLTTTKTEVQSGNPAYLNLVLACQQQRRTLLGLDAPTRAQEFVITELKAGLERLRANLTPALFQQVAGLLAGRAGDAVSHDGNDGIIDVDS